MTWAEKMVEQGREEGRREGREQERGQEARQIVLDLLGECFGAVPDRVRQQVEEVGSVDRLRFLAKRILKAGSLEELGLA